MKKPIFSEVNKGVRKVDGVSLATGRARFTDDYELSGMLCGKILRSPHAFARIKRIRTARARSLPGVTAVLTYRDLPRISITSCGQTWPEAAPYDEFILDRYVRYVGDKVALVAAESEEVAERALDAIEVEYEVLIPLLDPRRAMEPGAPVIHPEKEAHVIIPVIYRPEINQVACLHEGDGGASLGDVDRALAKADPILHRAYQTQFANHVPTEPHCAIGYLDESGRLVIISPTQAPFHVRRILARALSLPVKKIRVIKPRMGGGFGGKQDVILEQCVAALALKTGRPVKIRLTRWEVFTSTRVRHPISIEVSAGADRTGKLRGLDISSLVDTGAYGTQGFPVATCVGLRTLPLFNCPDLRFQGDVVYTNHPVGGAYRGYGGTQGIFAVAVTLDELAEKVGIDPVDFYLKNIISADSEVPILAQLGEGESGNVPRIRSCELAVCIRDGAKAFDWKTKRKRPRDRGRYRRGVGMSIMMQGSSIPFIEMASAFIKMNDDGSFNLLMGATELGQGSDTVLAQIVAEELTVKTDDIIVYSSDTDLTPYDVGAFASSTTYLSGLAVKKTAWKVKEQIRRAAARIMGTDPELVRFESGRVIAPDKKSISFQEIALSTLYQNEQFQIAASASHLCQESPPPYAANFAEIEVDTYTGKVRVIKYLQAIDCGTVINPVTARGQALGGVVNALSYALTERYIFDKKGNMLNPNYAYYKIFGTRDIPEITTIFVPSHEPTGPFGAKSLGELVINGGLPSISNAIHNATGVRLRDTPFTPDKVLSALDDRGK